MSSIQVASKLEESLGFKRRGVIGSFPSAVFGEVPLDPDCAEGVGGDIYRDAVVVA